MKKSNIINGSSFRMKTQRWALTLALTFALMQAFTLPAFAAETVNLSTPTTLRAMKEAIYYAINAASGGDGIVIVTGAYNGLLRNDYVSLNIPANVTVRWEGVYHNNIVTVSDTYPDKPFDSLRRQRHIRGSVGREQD